MRRFGIVGVLVLVAIVLATSLCFAATIEGGGRQTRGYPGHNAELYGEVFVFFLTGTITNVTAEGTDGFWIEKASGENVISFNTLNQAIGYSLPASSKRVLPNLRDYPEKANRSWVRITVNCP